MIYLDINLIMLCSEISFKIEKQQNIVRKQGCNEDFEREFKGEINNFDAFYCVIRCKATFT